MKYLEFEVKSMTLGRKGGDKTAPISGSVNYFGVSVDFDEDFASIPGGKSVEFFKNKATTRRDLIDGKCGIPNELLKDKDAFEMRIVSGCTVATPWVKIVVTESGSITPEEPEEQPEEGMEYVKTQSGDNAVPFLRVATNGLEFSKNGEDWEGGLSGVPEVPKKPNGAKYLRVHGDWIPYEEPEIPEVPDLTELQGRVESNSTAVEKHEQAIEELKKIEGLTGVASTLTELADDETDPVAIAAKVNEIISLLRTRGIATT
jgi:hypothetical protein